MQARKQTLTRYQAAFTNSSCVRGAIGAAGGSGTMAPASSSAPSSAPSSPPSTCSSCSPASASFASLSAPLAVELAGWLLEASLSELLEMLNSHSQSSREPCKGREGAQSQPAQSCHQSCFCCSAAEALEASLERLCKATEPSSTGLPLSELCMLKQAE